MWLYPKNNQHTKNILKAYTHWNNYVKFHQYPFIRSGDIALFNLLGLFQISNAICWQFFWTSCVDSVQIMYSLLLHLYLCIKSWNKRTGLFSSKNKKQLIRLSQIMSLHHASHQVTDCSTVKETDRVIICICRHDRNMIVFLRYHIWVSLIWIMWHIG